MGMQTNMTWEQKLMALQMIADTSLRMRKPGDWYVSTVGRDIGGNGILVGSYGNGATPQLAVEDDWRLMVETIPRDLYIATPKGKFRWAGFMWAPA